MAVGRRRPEILAPAGDLEAMRAALGSGADAVYFGLDVGFNARARAHNFSLENLADVCALVHRAGARAYLTLNTLVFEPELAMAARLVAAAARAGVDALIVQDPAVALLARAVAPGLELHASTQMTVSSAEGARFAAELGFTRVVVPRELSVAEIRAMAEGTPVELEVFIHGALCVSWSGQCLSSEAWGGRSANRGQCAQACRLPYELEVDGERRPLGEVEYLLSPADLAGVRAVPELVDIGVHGLKIEGRLKAPAYVASTVAGYRRWVDSVWSGAPDAEAMRADVGAMALAYSRGLSDGFLGGSDHQRLVEGRFPKHRGVYLGRVMRVVGDEVEVDGAAPGREWTGGRAAAEALEAPHGAVAAAARLDAAADASVLAPAVEPREGMGVVFDAGAPGSDEEGGRIFGIERAGARRWVLRFGRPGPDLTRVAPGTRVWVSGDPAAASAAAKLAAQPELEVGGSGGLGRVALALRVRGRAGQPLVVDAEARGFEARAESSAPLASARGAGLGREVLADKLGALGGTPFHLASLDAGGLDAGLHLPVSELKELRRALVAELTPRLERGAAREVSGEAPDDVIARVRAGLAAAVQPRDAAPEVVPLCRTDEQLDAAIAAGFREVELDWMEFVGLGHAVRRARAAGARVVIATVRVQKPGEEGYDARVARLEPDGVLVRHLGAVTHFREARGGPVLHGDFSLNATNSLTALHLLSSGLDTVTCAHDLDAAQVFALLERVPAGRVAVTVHHHIPTFHTEHCVYAHLLSGGRDFRSCGRPCESHRVSLRDRVGLVHPVLVDVGCRNTIFNAQAQSAATLVPRLLAAGVRRLRVELVRESAAETTRVLTAYRDLVAGSLSPAQALARAGTQFGLTRGTMRVDTEASR
ncbi:MAG TPA: U32 family peptidase [Kofleriaceae bacterium]|nr:U32 family peptidase [Kofleriaceae bacterium]